MTSLKGNIVNRVARLPKPSSSSEALQPLFEAVSNAMHAVEDRFGPDFKRAAKVYVEILSPNKPESTRMTIADNGIGLDDIRFDAFCTTDTDFKRPRGGKGVGRLLWLDAFDNISVDSVFDSGHGKFRRKFTFKLEAADQIVEEPLEALPAATPTGTSVVMQGLKGAYQSRFPAQAATLARHFGSHFLADFLLDQSPHIAFTSDGFSAEFPAEVLRLLRDVRGTRVIETADFGPLRLSSFICEKEASADFDGTHQLHFVANGRTVMTRKIDGLLGIGKFGENTDLVFHGCVSGEFLDDKVNQERTHFNFADKVAEQIAKACADDARSNALSSEIDTFDDGRLSTLNDFLRVYPTFQFDEASELLKQTPKNAIKPEQFAQALIVPRIRRDEVRREQVREIVQMLQSDELPSDFADAVRTAASNVRAEEQRQLTEYVLRRKMVLDVLEVLIRKVREVGEQREDYHLEQTLHQFISPMKLRGDDPTKVEASDHDLWIIDERLAFARYFASDVPFREIISESQSGDRPDLLLFDKLHGLGLDGEEPLRRVMLVEFKKPGRTAYAERYSPQNQILRYLNEIKGGQITSFSGERIRVTEDCIFYCFVVADIVGDLDIHTSSWTTTSNGRGRWTSLAGKYRGSIEVIEWRDLVSDARSRNQAFIHAAGL